MQLKLNRLQMIRMATKKIRDPKNAIVYAATGCAICKLGSFFDRCEAIWTEHCLILTPTRLSVQWVGKMRGNPFIFCAYLDSGIL